MARKAPHIQVVKSDDLSVNPADAQAEVKSVTQAASSGTHRELLVAMRDRIARAVEDDKCPPRDLASLSRRLHEIAKEIEVIDLTDGDPEVAGSGADVDDEDFDEAAI